MKQGFSLLEVVIVIIIIGILATLGIIQYEYVIESYRKAEAKISLGQLRKSEVAYYQKAQRYGSIRDLGLDLPITSGCDPQYYFYYNCDTTNGKCCADRCEQGSSGKKPNAREPYRICLGIEGNFLGGY